jgi:phospholipid transport system transporter-binding protein
MQLGARLGFAEAKTELERLLPAVAAAAGSRVELDASALSEFDSSAIAVIMELRRAAARAGGTLALRGAPPKLIKLAQLYGVAPLIEAGPPAQGPVT